jgi:5-formyltetrahydrofolate cyclo-ligase
VGGQVPSIALLYDDELVDEVPVDEHDQAVRAVARPGAGVTWLPE